MGESRDHAIGHLDCLVPHAQPPRAHGQAFARIQPRVDDHRLVGFVLTGESECQVMLAFVMTIDACLEVFLHADALG